MMYKTTYGNTVSVTRPLRSMPYAQAGVREFENGARDLISYTTLVASVSDKQRLYVFGLYSPTTRKHISAFMKELGLDYSIAKTCVEKRLCYNIATGEYESLITV